MPSNWGNLYNQAVARYNGLSIQDRAALQGYNYGGVDEGGRPIWTAEAGAGVGGRGVSPNVDAGESSDQYVRNNTRFDTQQFFNNAGIIPIDPTLTNDGPYPGAPRMSQEVAQQWRDNYARSFNRFGYNFRNYDDMLRYTTGPGQYVDDPTLGRVWVPNNRDSQTWNLGYMGASANGSGWQSKINGALNNGALVYGLAGAIAGAGITDAFGNPLAGGTDLPSGMDLAGDGGINNVGNYTSPSLPAPPTPADVVNPYVDPAQAGNVVTDELGGTTTYNADGTIASQTDPTIGASSGSTATNTVIGPDAASGAQNAGDLLRQGQQVYKTINGVRQLVDAATGQPVTKSLPRPGSTPSANTANAVTGGPNLTAGDVVTGLSLFDQLLNQGSPPDTASANAALQQEIATTAAQQAANNWNFYRTNYRPVEEALTSSALTAGSPEAQDQRAAQAGAAVTQAAHNAAAAEQLRQDQLGIRPDSGNSLALANDRAINTSANVAAGMNKARQDERVYGDQLRSNVTSLGRGSQNTAIAATNAATNAASGSTNSAATQQNLSNNQNANLGTLASVVDKSGVLNGMFSNSTPATPVYDSVASGYNGYTSTNDPSYGTGNVAQNWGAVTGPDDFAKGGQVKKRLTKPPSMCGYLKGGRVHGPGTGTSDSIPVNIDGERPGHIAHGEYVINAKAVKKIGLKKLDRMNMKGLPKGSKMKDGVHLVEDGANMPAGMAARERATGTRYMPLPRRLAA